MPLSSKRSLSHLSSSRGSCAQEALRRLAPPCPRNAPSSMSGATFAKRTRVAPFPSHRELAKRSSARARPSQPAAPCKQVRRKSERGKDFSSCSEVGAPEMRAFQPPPVYSQRCVENPLPSPPLRPLPSHAGANPRIGQVSC